MAAECTAALLAHAGAAAEAPRPPRGSVAAAALDCAEQWLHLARAVPAAPSAATGEGQPGQGQPTAGAAGQGDGSGSSAGHFLGLACDLARLAARGAEAGVTVAAEEPGVEGEEEGGVRRRAGGVLRIALLALAVARVREGRGGEALLCLDEAATACCGGAEGEREAQAVAGTRALALSQCGRRQVRAALWRPLQCGTRRTSIVDAPVASHIVRPQEAWELTRRMMASGGAPASLCLSLLGDVLEKRDAAVLSPHGVVSHAAFMEAALLLLRRLAAPDELCGAALELLRLADQHREALPHRGGDAAGETADAHDALLLALLGQQQPSEADAPAARLRQALLALGDGGAERGRAHRALWSHLRRAAARHMQRRDYGTAERLLQVIGDGRAASKHGRADAARGQRFCAGARRAGEPGVRPRQRRPAPRRAADAGHVLPAHPAAGQVRQAHGVARRGRGGRAAPALTCGHSTPALPP